MAFATVGLQTHIWNNNLRSLLLLAIYPLLLIGLAWLIAALFGFSMGTSMNGSAGAYDPAKSWDQAQFFANRFIVAYWPLIITVVAVWFIIAFFLHTRMIRMLAHSHPVTRAEEPALYNLLENLCIAQGVTMPRLEIIETDALNAFASGIDKKSYAITVTRGLLQTLPPEELEAVLAHELTHIMNNDVRLLIISVIFTGMLGFLAQMMWSNLRYSMMFGRRSRSRQSGGAALFVLVVALILWLGYLATLFTRFALSRRREFMADAGAVEMTKNPEAMMKALMRISGRDQIKFATADIALMCIENRRRFIGIFATHPPIERRVEALSEVTGAPIPLIETPDTPEKSKNPWL